MKFMVSIDCRSSSSTPRDRCTSESIKSGRILLFPMSLYVRRSNESQGLHLYLHLVSFSVRVKKHSLINYGNMQNVGLLLKEWDSFTVDVPELRLLRNYHSDAVSWVSHSNDVLGRVHRQEDQQNSVDELKSILEEGLSLKIQGIVDYFSLDLSKARAIVYFLVNLQFPGFIYALQLMSCL